MSEEGCLSIEASDFLFENSFVTLTAMKNIPKIDLVGFFIGPFEEGCDYEVRFWVARELEKENLVKVREGGLDAAKIYKIQWTERIQAPGQLSTLPEDFYPRIKRTLSDLRASARINPEKMREYEHIKNLTHDIVNCRLRKIVSLASIPAPESQTLKNLTPEERELYEKIRQIVTEWRAKIV